MTEQNQGAGQVPEEFSLGPGTTGRYIVVTAPASRVEQDAEQGVTILSSVAGVSPDETSEAGEVDPEVLTNPDASVNFPDLGILVTGGVDQEKAAQIATMVEDPTNPLQAIRPERFYHPFQEEPEEEEWSGAAAQQPFEEDYIEEEPTGEGVASGAQHSRAFLEGYQAAVQNLLEKVAATDLPLLVQEVASATFHESRFTWGLQVTKAATSKLSGTGIKVAVLDTGLDLGHPDFQGRSIQSRSFIANEPVQDGNGHGTHCIGTACGPRAPFRNPGRLPSYGCASNCDIFAGKVLSNRGSGTFAQITAGMQWAINSGCQVISMSLGVPVCNRTNRGFNQGYENIARVGLQQGTLIVAAAGNNSGRPTSICGIHPDSPAAAPSILGVGALNEQLQMAPFSDAGLFPPHGAVNIAAPGGNVYSSWPRPQLSNRISGTSMATPHVAGIAALWAEANSMFRGTALGTQLLHSTRRLALPRRDVGAGLVQAP